MNPKRTILPPLQGGPGGMGVPGVKTPGLALLPLRGTKLECRHPSVRKRLPGLKMT